MSTGEVHALETEKVVVPLSKKLPTHSEFIGENTEIEISVSEKITANVKVRERFSRLKKSLRKRSVSIL